MKKYLLMAVAFVAAISANAQTEGKNSVEIGFNPFTQTKNTFSIDELKYRHYWGANALRVRVGFGVDAAKNTTTTTTNNALNNQSLTTFDGSEQVTTGSFVNGVNDDFVPRGYQPNPNINQTVETRKTNNKNLDFSFAIGYEREFKVAERVNLFAGAEFFYSHLSTIEKVNKTTEETIDKLSNNNDVYELHKLDSKLEYTKTTKGLNAENTIGINFVGGIDFHVYKGLYLGAELGLGIHHAISGKGATVTEETTYAANETCQKKTGNNPYTDNYVQTTDYTMSIKDGVTTYSGTRVKEDKKDSKTYTTVVNYEKVDPKEVEKKNHKTNFLLYAEPALRIGYRF